MKEAGLEKMDPCGSDQSGPDVCSDLRRLYCGGGSAGGGTVAPCTFCEWCGICPQHFDEPGDRSAGGRSAGANRTA